MSETVGWPEGDVYLWTGDGTGNAIAYATRTQVTFAKGWMNFQTLDSAYHDIFTGQRVDVQVGAMFTTDNERIRVLFDAQTAVHMHFVHTVNGVSAGHFLYSGRIDQMIYAGQENGIYQHSLTYHANVWSAY